MYSTQIVVLCYSLLPAVKIAFSVLSRTVHFACHTLSQYFKSISSDTSYFLILFLSSSFVVFFRCLTSSKTIQLSHKHIRVTEKKKKKARKKLNSIICLFRRKINEAVIRWNFVLMRNFPHRWLYRFIWYTHIHTHVQKIQWIFQNFLWQIWKLFLTLSILFNLYAYRCAHKKQIYPKKGYLRGSVWWPHVKTRTTMR